MTAVEWYWTLFSSGAGLLIFWALVTACCSGSFRKDYWTPQAQWFTKTITAPVQWVAGIVTSPAALLREHWAHKERMLAHKKASEAEARLAVLESALIKGDA